MPHMLLIHEPVGQRATRSDAEGRAVYERMLRWGDELKERGLLLGAESLSSLDHAVRVSTAGGRARIVDGPFAEAKEMVGGFYLLDVDTREEAVALAQRCPAAEWATVEVRALAPCFEP
ncbi:YciI family protein [Massilia sp. ST3]|uniref:YciI family protein n=1 Tax=Massilia sp. ST3 TaxID=2824903 RepID=UPI001B81D8B2|nr:YciI family protein [Massilia sp. ST3]MBQ5946959.1 dehydrogenase [Massilia sp. ST3]